MNMLGSKTRDEKDVQTCLLGSLNFEVELTAGSIVVVLLATSHAQIVFVGETHNVGDSWGDVAQFLRIVESNLIAPRRGNEFPTMYLLTFLQT